MTTTDVSPEEMYNASRGLENDYVNSRELEELIAIDQSLIVIDLRAPGSVQEQEYKNTIYLSMENMVTENLEKLIPVKSTPIVLICDSSYGLSRMVALTTYAYPTLKLMGYNDLKILQE